MLCSRCSDLTVEKLLDLHTLHLNDKGYGWEDFPREAFYTHHSSFESLTISAEGGCEFCHVILNAFAVNAAFMDDIDSMIEMDLDTRIRIYMGLNRRESPTPEQIIFDRLFVKFGFDNWEFEEGDGDELSTEISDSNKHSGSELSWKDDREYPWPGRRIVLLSLKRGPRKFPIISHRHSS